MSASELDLWKSNAAETGSEPSVGIVVLNWNGKQDTLECLDSLAHLTYPRYEVIVVDNASSDGSVGVIRRDFPQVLVLENPRNLGYTGGNNVGIRCALGRGAELVLLLNNDTTVDPDFLGRLVEAVRSSPDVGICGPTIYFHDKPDVIWSAGGAVDWRRGTSWMMDLNGTGVQTESTARQVDFVTGCALLARSEVFGRIGLLDERLFAYWEEVEFCVRAQRAGYRTLHASEARVWRKISLARQSNSPSVCYYMARNRLLFLRAAGVGWRTWLNCLTEYARTLASWSLQPKYRSLRGHRKALARGIRDFLVGRVGEAPAL